jgi:hypothetical protein
MMLDRLRVWWILHRRLNRWLFAALGLVVVGIVAVLVLRQSWPGPDQRPVSAEVLAAREAGNYDRVLRLLGAGLRKEPGNAQLAEIHNQLTSPLRVEAHLLRSASAPAAEGGAAHGVSAAETAYAFLLTLPEPCFVYMFRFSGSGTVEMLFPRPEARNPCAAGPQRIPSGQQWLHSEGSGEKVCLVAARWAVMDLERLGAAITSEKDQQRKRLLVGRLRERLELEERYGPKLEGLVSGHYVVTQSGPRTLPNER